MSIKKTKVEIKPCPFCGRKPMFTVASCDSWQIICKTFDEVDSRGEFVGCGARILQFFPIRYPKGTWVKGKFKTTTDNLAIWAYNKLVPKWNRRAKL